MTGPPYPYIEFALRVGTWEIAEVALPDTGYDGDMLIPVVAAGEISGAAREDDLYTADGAMHVVQSWHGELQLSGRAFPVTVKGFGREFIVGRGVLDQLEVCFEFGERVRLRFEREGSE